MGQLRFSAARITLLFEWCYFSQILNNHHA